MAAQTRTIEVDERFNLDKTLRLNTQDFRWDCWRDPQDVDWHSGVLKGHLVHVRQDGRVLKYRASEDANLDKMLHSYFRFDEDVEAVHQALASVDGTMARLVKDYPHMRVLHQPDPWETTVAFICSVTNRIERMRESVENIAKDLGEDRELEGEVRRTFPRPGAMRESGVERLAGLTVGIPALPKRILLAAQRCQAGSLDLARLANPGVCYAEARLQLMASAGIAAKVAACIALFALAKPDAFPVDTYVRRGLKRSYPDAPLGPTEGEALAIWAREHFGQHAGYASQLLFLSEYLRSKKP